MRHSEVCQATGDVHVSASFALVHGEQQKHQEYHGLKNYLPALPVPILYCNVLKQCDLNHFGSQAPVMHSCYKDATSNTQLYVGV